MTNHEIEQALGVGMYGVTQSGTPLNETKLKRVEIICVLLKKQKLNMCGDGNVT